MSDQTGLHIVAENSEDMVAIANILKALEGMQENLSALSDLVIDLAGRVESLEKKSKPKLILVRS